MFVGAFHALPLGLGDVAVEAREPRAVAAKVRTAVGQVRCRFRHRLAPWLLLHAEAREERPRIFGEVLFGDRRVLLRRRLLSEAGSRRQQCHAGKNQPG